MRQYCNHPWYLGLPPSGSVLLPQVEMNSNEEGIKCTLEYQYGSSVNNCLVDMNCSTAELILLNILAYISVTLGD